MRLYPCENTEAHEGREVYGVAHYLLVPAPDGQGYVNRRVCTDCFEKAKRERKAPRVQGV